MEKVQTHIAATTQVVSRQRLFGGDLRHFRRFVLNVYQGEEFNLDSDDGGYYWSHQKSEACWGDGT